MLRAGSCTDAAALGARVLRSRYRVLFVAMRFWLAYVGVRPFSASGARSRARSTPATYDVTVRRGRQVADRRRQAAVLSRRRRQLRRRRRISGDCVASATSAATPSRRRARRRQGLRRRRPVRRRRCRQARWSLIAVVVAMLAAFGGGIVFLIVSRAAPCSSTPRFGAAITSGIVPATQRADRRAATGKAACRHATWKPRAVARCSPCWHRLPRSRSSITFPAMRTLGEAFAVAALTHGDPRKPKTSTAAPNAAARRRSGRASARIAAPGTRWSRRVATPAAKRFASVAGARTAVTRAVERRRARELAHRHRARRNSTACWAAGSSPAA